MSKPVLEVTNLSFGYTPEEPILESIHFSVQPGEILGVIGESGCGKSTLLKLLAGKLTPTNGTLLLDGEVLPNPDDLLIRAYEGITYVAQDFDLKWSHSVLGNLNVELRQYETEYAERFADRILALLELKGKEPVKPKILSGGQQQRLAIGIGLASHPQLLLLDEPFSQLNETLRLKLIQHLKAYVREEEIALVLVSHSPTTYLDFCDRLLVLNQKRVVQSGSPKSVYRQPVSEKVRQLTGGTVQFFSSADKDIGPIRPENLLLLFKSSPSEENEFKARVTGTQFHGFYHTVWFKVENTNIEAYTYLYQQDLPEPGQAVVIKIKA